MRRVLFCFAIFCFAIFFALCGREKGEKLENILPDETLKSRYKADIYIDKYGIPHIFSEDLESAFFAFGFISARNKFYLLQGLKFLATGRVSEILKVQKAIEQDMLMQKINTTIDGRYVPDEIEKKLKDYEVYKLLSAYVDGINFFIKRLRDGNEEKPPEYKILKFPEEDFSVKDVIAIARLYGWYLVEDQLTLEPIMTYLSSISDVFSDFISAFPVENTFTLKPSSLKPSYIFLKPSYIKESNNFVISATLSSNGKPILGNDPHLPILNPSILMGVHIKSNIEVYGFSLVGVPAIFMGTNGLVGWGMTNSGTDIIDIYSVEVTNSANCESGFAIMENGSGNSGVGVGGDSSGWVEVCLKKREVIVGGEKKEIFVSEYGVVLDDEISVGEKTSMRWTGQEITQDALGLFGIMKARNAEEFSKALTMWRFIAPNMVFMDRKDIGFSQFSLVPKRSWDLKKHPPHLKLTCCKWNGFEELEKTPFILNPSWGYIVSANNDIPGYTEDGDPYNDKIYLLWSYDPGWRVSRITQLIKNKISRGEKIDVEYAKGIQLDTNSIYSQFIFPKIITLIKPLEDFEGKVFDILKSWKGTCLSGFIYRDDLSVEEIPDQEIRKESAGCLIFWTLQHFILRETFSDEFKAIGQEGILPYLEDFALKTIYLSQKSLIKRNYFDNVQTEKEETFQDIVSRAFSLTVAFLSERLGDLSNWLWGKIARLKLASVFTLAGVSAFEIQPLPSPLSPLAPAVAWINLADADFIKSSIHFGGPALRLILYFEGEKIRAIFSLPGGQSGMSEESKLSREKHFLDLLPYYLRGEYIPIFTTEMEIKENLHKKISIIPF